MLFFHLNPKRVAIPGIFGKNQFIRKRGQYFQQIVSDVRIITKDLERLIRQHLAKHLAYFQQGDWYDKSP